MKQTILIAILSGAAAGALSAVVATNLAPGSDGPARSDDSAGLAAPAAAPDAASRSDLAKLAKQLEALDVRVQMLADRPAPAPVERQPVVVPASAEQQGLALEMQKLVAALQDPNGQVPDALWNGVNTALQDIREKEDREREARRQERALERIDERLATMSVELGLDRRQSDQLRAAWVDEMDRMAETFAQARDTGDFMAVRDSMREIRTATSDTVSLILTPSQYEKYQELSPGGFGGFGGGGFGRGGRGGFGGFGNAGGTDTP